jgi:hypothetical protein
MENPAITGIAAMMATPGPAELGPGPRPGVQPVAAINRWFDLFVEKANPDSDTGGLIRALVLLWHDHLDEAHEIAQSIETGDGSLVHGIVHRREPDPGNAKYWFHRAGSYPGFAGIGKQVAELLDAKGEAALKRRLVPGGLWDAVAFVDACAEAGQKPGQDGRDHLLRQIQQIEIETLMEYFSAKLPGVDQE